MALTRLVVEPSPACLSCVPRFIASCCFVLRLISLAPSRPLSKTVRFNVLRVDRVLSGGGKQFGGL